MSYPVILQNAKLLEEVDHEMVRAERLFAPMVNAHEAYSVLLEEVDEFWEQVKTNQKRRDYAAMRSELIQIAAMALRAIKDTITEDPPYRAQALEKKAETSA